MPRKKKLVRHLAYIKGLKKTKSASPIGTTTANNSTDEDPAQKSIMGETAVAKASKKRAGPPAKPVVEKKHVGHPLKTEMEKKRVATDEASNEAKKMRRHLKGPDEKAAQKVLPTKGGTGRRGRPKKSAIKELAEESAEEPAKESTKEPANEAANEPAKEAADEPAKEATDEPAKEGAKE